MSVIAEHARMKLQIQRLEAKCQELARDLKTMRELVWTVQIAGAGYLYRAPDGTNHAIDPMNIVQVIANDDTVPDVERLTAEVRNLRSDLDTAREALERTERERDYFSSLHQTAVSAWRRALQSRRDLKDKVKALADLWSDDNNDVEMMSHEAADILEQILEGIP